MFRGRYPLGEEVPLSVLCRNNARTPTAPVAAPAAAIWLGSTKIQTITLPAIDRAALTGLFGKGLFLGAAYTTGLYEVFYTYTVGSLAVVEVDQFEVVDSGDPNGSVIAMYGFERPQATFLVHQVDSGKIKRGKNPRVS